MNYGYFCGVLYCGECGGKFATHNIINILANGEAIPNISYRCYQKALSCKSPDINHTEVETAFLNYIQSIDTPAENNSNIDCEKKMTFLQDRKNQVMEQYVQGLIDFDEYKNMTKLLNENYNVAKAELQRMKHESIIQDLKQNWQYFDIPEKAVFLQRHIRKIVTAIDSNIVKIDSVEFHTAERSTSDLQIGELQNRQSVRAKLQIEKNR
jgi:hypothetical protein